MGQTRTRAVNGADQHRPKPPHLVKKETPPADAGTGQAKRLRLEVMCRGRRASQQPTRLLTWRLKAQQRRRAVYVVLRDGIQ